MDSINNASNQLLALTHDKDDKVCCEAVWALGALGEKAATKSALDRLLELSTDAQGQVCLLTVKALGKVGKSANNQRVIKHLSKLAKCGKNDIEFAAVEALIELKGEEDPGIFRLLVAFWRTNLGKSDHKFFAGGYGSISEIAFNELNRMGTFKFLKSKATNASRRN